MAKLKNPSKSESNLVVSALKPKTVAQRSMIESWLHGNNLIAAGSSGTGKSYVAAWLALVSILVDKTHSKIIYVRSAVPTRDQGFLTGDINEKSAVFFNPFRKMINDLCENDTAAEILEKKRILDFTTTGYLRGETFDNAIIIAEEFQNMDFEELITIMTRIGVNTRLILAGDTRQNDLFRSREKSCFDDIMKVANRMPDEIDVINFYPEDIVRSGFVKKLIMVLEE